MHVYDTEGEIVGLVVKYRQYTHPIAGFWMPNRGEGGPGPIFTPSFTAVMRLCCIVLWHNTWRLTADDAVTCRYINAVHARECC